MKIRSSVQVFAGSSVALSISVTASTAVYEFLLQITPQPYAVLLLHLVLLNRSITSAFCICERRTEDKIMSFSHHLYTLACRFIIIIMYGYVHTSQYMDVCLH